MAPCEERWGRGSTSHITWSHELGGPGELEQLYILPTEALYNFTPLQSPTNANSVRHNPS